MTGTQACGPLPFPRYQTTFYLDAGIWRRKYFIGATHSKFRNVWDILKSENCSDKSVRANSSEEHMCAPVRLAERASGEQSKSYSGQAAQPIARRCHEP